ncbi:unnamed protein product, partial [Staurois parvus]
MDPQQVMFSGFPSDETAVVITTAVKLIKSPVQNNGNPENMTCWGSMRTGVEKHCPRGWVSKLSKQGQVYSRSDLREARLAI